MTTGRLVVVATPIGNLDELSPRARHALATADVVACEDTRRTGRLFQLAELSRPATFTSLHGHNEASRVDELVDTCRGGATVALVSDAGMPTISDPGSRLVDAMHGAGLPVSVVSGPSAVVSALAVSGFDASRFVFEGFLPRKGITRTRVLGSIAAETRTVVVYESPHRVVATVDDLAAIADPSRRLVVVRELSKLYEETWRGPLGEASAALAASPVRGEHVLVVEGGVPPAGPSDDELRDAVRDLIDGGHTKRDAATEVAARFGVGRRRVYDLANAS